MTTLAPDLAKRKEVAAPIPLLPPVIRAVLPKREADISAVAGALDRCYPVCDVILRAGKSWRTEASAEGTYYRLAGSFCIHQ